MSLLLRFGVNQTSSSPRGSHPQALTEPDLNVSAHPALIVQPQGGHLGASSGEIYMTRAWQSFPPNVLLSFDDLVASYISWLPTKLPGDLNGEIPGKVLTYSNDRNRQRPWSFFKQDLILNWAQIFNFASNCPLSRDRNFDSMMMPFAGEGW